MKKFIALVLILCMALSLVSCSVNNNDKASANTAKMQSPETHEDVAESDDIAKEEKGEKSEETKPEEKMELVLYFSDEEALSLHADIRELDAKITIDEKYVLNELMKGPQAEGLINVIPANTTLNSCEVSQRVCTVDFSAHFLDAAGSASELMAIYSVVNTLCELDTVDCVQFTIDGQKVMAFGSYQFDEPFEADMTLVE